MLNMKRKKRTISLSAMVAIIITGFSIITSVALGTILTIVSVTKMKNIISNKTLELANTAAAMLDGDAIKDLKKEDIGSEAYEKAYTTLEAFKISNKGANGEFAYIYGCRKTGDHAFEFTFDPSDDPAEFGELLEWTKALESASKGVAAFDKDPYTDRWGTFYSAYAPVFDSNGEVVMMVGIDVWAEWYNDTVWSSSNYIIIVSAISVVSGILVGVLINIRIRKRFETLSTEYNALEGDIRTLISEIVEPIDGKETVETIDSTDHIVQLREKIHATQKEIKEYIIYTKKMAYVDALSRVGNRTAYLEKVKQLDYSFPFAVILFDIDGLKYINDNFGHEIGDKAIVVTSDILQSVFDKTTIYRIGGDEFVVLLEGSDKDTTTSLYNSIDAKFFAFNNRNELPFPLHVSKGIAFFDNRKDKSLVDVFNRADEDMYHNKEEFYKQNPELKKKYRR